MWDGREVFVGIEVRSFCVLYTMPCESGWYEQAPSLDSVSPRQRYLLPFQMTLPQPWPFPSTYTRINTPLHAQGDLLQISGVLSLCSCVLLSMLFCNLDYLGVAQPQLCLPNLENRPVSFWAASLSAVDWNLSQHSKLASKSQGSPHLFPLAQGSLPFVA